MINRQLTDSFIKDFDSLAEAIYLCWHNSFSSTTNRTDEVILRKQIRSYGFYRHKNTIRKELPLSLRNTLKFRNLLWVNQYTDTMAEDSLSECTEHNKQVIKETETNLFEFKSRTERIAYANIILRDIDKNCIHNKKVENSIRDIRYKEIFEYILNHHFISEDNVTVFDDGRRKIYPIYELTVKLINHFDFIDRLIEVFTCFGINLVQLAEKAGYNLYLFNNNKSRLNDINQNGDLVQKIIPKFNSTLSDECLIKIMHYLSAKKRLDSPNTDVWLFWFNRKTLKTYESLRWKGTPTMLSNIIQHVCGECISETIKTAFCTKDYVKPTRKEYEVSKIYKELEQFIIISHQKNS